MRITPLASGSQGNSLLIESAGACLLIDAGLRVDELEARLADVGLAPRQVDALFVTHRHRDHIQGATDMARRHKLRIITTRRTARSIGSEAQRRLTRVEFDRTFAVGDLSIRAIRLPHDAPETAALVVDAGSVRFGYATDLGMIERTLVDALQNCAGLFVEFNHDRPMLDQGADPPHLKRRITSGKGHLSNAQGADLLARTRHAGLRQVWLAHLSARNNTPELAIAAARAVVGPEIPIAVAAQQAVGVPVDLTPTA